MVPGLLDPSVDRTLESVFTIHEGIFPKHAWKYQNMMKSNEFQCFTNSIPKIKCEVRIGRFRRGCAAQ